MEKMDVKLSVIETENKYYYDPTETTYGGKDAIVSWGPDNNIPNLLLNCYESSPSLKAACDMAVNYVLGDNVSVTESLWSETINRRGETMKDLIEHLAADYEIFGNFCFEVIFNLLGTPVELYAIDVAKCRLNEDGDKVFYSKKRWTKYQTKAEVFDRFGRAKFDPEHPAQMFFYNGTGIRRTYNKSPWGAALDDVLTEIEASKYALNCVSNGFSVKHFISFPDASLTDEQKRNVEDGIKNKLTGSEGNTFAVYWKGTEDISIQKIESDSSPEKMAEIKKQSTAAIFTSMKMSPLLCGLAAENVGFSTTEFRDSFALYERSVARPTREIITKCIESVIANDIKITITPFTIDFGGQE